MRRSAFFARRRLIGGTLLVSLAVNAFFVGALAMDVVSAGAHRYPHEAGDLFRLDLRWLDDRLPDDAMRKIVTDVGRGASGAEARFEHLQDLRTDLGGLVAVPNPDHIAIETKLAEIRTELDHLLSETQAATMASVLALPADTRANLADSTPDT